MQPPTHIKHHSLDLVLDNHPLNYPFQCLINPQITLRDLFQVEETPGFSSDNCTFFSSCGSSSSSLNSCSLYEETIFNANSTNYSKPSSSSRIIMSPPNSHIGSSNVIARLMGIQDFPQYHKKEFEHGRNTVSLDNNNNNNNNKCDTIARIKHFSEDQMQICQEGVPTKAERSKRGFLHGQAKSMSEDELKPVWDESNYGFMSQTIEKRLAQLGLQSSEKERRCLAHLLEMMKQKGRSKSRAAQTQKDSGRSTKPVAMPLILPILQHSMLKSSLGDSVTDNYPVSPMKISKNSSSELHSAGKESSVQDINDLKFCNSFIKLAWMPSTTHPSSQGTVSSGYSSEIMSSSISSNVDIKATSLSANCSNSVQECGIDSSDQALVKKVAESELSGIELNSCEEKQIVEAPDVKIVVQEEKGGRSKTESLVSTKKEAACKKVQDLTNLSVLKSKSGKKTGNSRFVRGAATDLASIKATPKSTQNAKKQSMLSSNSKSSWKQPGKPNLESKLSQKPKISKPLLPPSKVRDQRQCHDHSNIPFSRGGNLSLTKQDSSTLRVEPCGRKKQQSKTTLPIKEPYPNRSRNEGKIKREVITRLPKKAASVLEQRKSSVTSSSNSARNSCSDQSQRKNEAISLQDRSHVIKSGCKAAGKSTRINNKKKASLQTTNHMANEQHTESKPCTRARDTLNTNDRAEGGNISNINEDEISKEGYKGRRQGINGGRNDDNLGNLSLIRGDKDMVYKGKGEAGLENGWVSQWLVNNSNLLPALASADVDSNVDSSARSPWQSRVILDCVADVLAGQLTCAFQQLHMGRHINTRHVPGGLPEIVARQVQNDVLHLQNLSTSSSGKGEKGAVSDDLADGRDTWHVQLDGELIRVVRVMEEMILGDVLQEELSSLLFIF